MGIHNWRFVTHAKLYLFVQCSNLNFELISVAFNFSDKIFKAPVQCLAQCCRIFWRIEVCKTTSKTSFLANQKIFSKVRIYFDNTHCLLFLLMAAGGKLMGEFSRFYQCKSVIKKRIFVKLLFFRSKNQKKLKSKHYALL